jgi:LAGLIDADG DNA endonuclease family
MSNYHRSIFVGILLGDASIRKIKLVNNNARIIFTQSFVNFPYFWYVFMELYPYCASLPRSEVTKIGSKKYYRMILATRNYFCLNELYDMFIIKGKKCVPNDIYNELSPVALAHWIMCDGSWARHGLIICTDSFTVKEVVQLMNVLLVRYNIISNLRKAADLPRIYIGSKEMPKLKTIINGLIIPFFMYKLGYKRIK